MLREEEEMLLRNNTNASEIEVDKDLIIKNPQDNRWFRRKRKWYWKLKSHKRSIVVNFNYDKIFYLFIIININN